MKKNEPRYDTTFSAAITGIKNTFMKSEPLGTLSDSDRIDGKTCLVTGSSSGLGKAAAVRLARRGGRVIMACRSGHPDAGEEVKKRSGSELVEMEKIDLTDFSSVTAFCDRLKERNEKIDIAVFNAGVVPGWSRKTKDGYEEMFQVNFLAKFLLVNRLLKDGTIPAGRGKMPNSGNRGVPRIIFVASEAHRGAGPIDFNSLGEFFEYDMGKSVAHYGYSKLLLTTFFMELSRRMEEQGKASVFALCPGAVNTNIARDIPTWVKPLARLVLTLFFNSPMKASDPILFLSVSPQVEGRSGLYLHIMTEKEVDPRASDEEAGKKLWEQAEKMVKEWL